MSTGCQVLPINMLWHGITLNAKCLDNAVSRHYIEIVGLTEKY
jgi:hypothetical protein